MGRYYKFSDFLKKRFNGPVHKITIDAGFDCPNRDGKKGTGGCIFCNNAAFSPAYSLRGESIENQIKSSIKRIQSKKKINQFIAYFQPFSNTYAPPSKLNALYEQALSFKEIVGIAVGTRPDCLDKDVLQVISHMAQKTHFWLEIGLETIHNQTLERINRGHTFEEFLLSYQEARKIPNLFICIHLIHGLPGESKEMMLSTIDKINELKPDAIKFHQLEIVKNTPLENDYLKGKIKLLSLDEYLDILGESLKRISPQIIIQRLFGFTPSQFLVAPLIEKKVPSTALLENYLEKQNLFQGQDSQKNNK